MPSRRSKSKDRERKRKARENMSEEQLAEKRAKARKDMKKIRYDKSKEGKEQRLKSISNRSRTEHLKKSEEEKAETEEEWGINWKIRYAKNAAQTKDNMKKKRAQQNDEEKQEENIKARERMRNLRAKKTDEEKCEESKEAKERMRKLRAKKTDDEKCEESQEAREKMRKLRVEEPLEKKEYKLIAQKHKRREARKQMSGKEHLIQNLHAKKGMNIFKEEGRIRNFERRSYKNRDELSDWKEFVQKGRTYTKIVQHCNPDIVDRLNQKHREEKESEKKRKEKENKGEWLYNGESGEYFWSGGKEPEYQDSFCYSKPTEEEEKIRKEAEEKEMLEYFEHRKKILKEKRKQKEMEKKEAMAIPVAPFPVKELCAYEKIREDIIKEREAAMAECKFFEDLDQFKKDVGLKTDDKVEALKSKPKKKPAQKIKKLGLNQKRAKHEHKMLNDDSLEKKFEGSEEKVADTENSGSAEKEFEGSEKDVEDTDKGVKDTEKEVKGKTRMKSRESDDQLRPDYSELYSSDAWLYFEME